MSVLSNSPPEILDTIIDHLHGDKIALGSCSLVSRSWLPASRFHLFGTTVIRSSARYGLSQILDVLSDPLSTVCRVARNLIIDGDYRFRANDMQVLCARASEGAFSAFTAVATLELKTMSFDSFHEFLSLLSAFNQCRVERVKLQDVRWANEDIRAAAPLRPQGSSLRSLSVRRCEMRSLLNWILTDRSIPPLSVVSLDNIDNPLVGRLLRALGQSLEHIVFNIPSLGCDENFSSLSALTEHIDLSYNTQLQSIYFDNVRLNRPQMRNMLCAFAILSRVASSQITTIEFHPVLSTFDHLHYFDWDTLDKMLSLPQFSSLTSVNMWMTIWNDYSWAIPNTIRSNMPLCTNRGILNIQVGSYHDFGSKYS